MQRSMLTRAIAQNSQRAVPIPNARDHLPRLGDSQNPKAQASVQPAVATLFNHGTWNHNAQTFLPGSFSRQRDAPGITSSNVQCQSQRSPVVRHDPFVTPQKTRPSLDTSEVLPQWTSTSNPFHGASRNSPQKSGAMQAGRLTSAAIFPTHQHPISGADSALGGKPRGSEPLLSAANHAVEGYSQMGASPLSSLQASAPVRSDLLSGVGGKERVPFDPDVQPNPSASPPAPSSSRTFHDSYSMSSAKLLQIETPHSEERRRRRGPAASIQHVQHQAIHHDLDGQELAGDRPATGLQQHSNGHAQFSGIEDDHIHSNTRTQIFVAPGLQDKPPPPSAVAKGDATYSSPMKKNPMCV